MARLSSLLELLAGAAFVAAAYLATHLYWPALVALGLVLVYLAQRRNHSLWLSHLQTLRVKPGDVLVARIPANLKRDEYQAAEKRLHREFNGAHVVCIPDSMELAKVELPGTKS